MPSSTPLSPETCARLTRRGVLALPALVLLVLALPAGIYAACRRGRPADRIVMLLADEQNIREVIMFPMNQRAEDLMMGAPAEATPKQLRELHIRLNLPEKGA